MDRLLNYAIRTRQPTSGYATIRVREPVHGEGVNERARTRTGDQWEPSTGPDLPLSSMGYGQVESIRGVYMTK